MEERKKLPVKISELFLHDLEAIFQYGLETFGIIQAELYEKQIWELVEGLSPNYLLFPECRHLQTKSKIYRWIILQSHLIIYRLRKDEVQVLRIIHSKRRVSYIKTQAV
jgi:toxin ParE1/3/4